MQEEEPMCPTLLTTFFPPQRLELTKSDGDLPAT